MSIDYNTLNYLNLKQNDVEEVSTHSDNDNIYFNVTLKRKDCKCPNCNNLTNKVKDYKIKIIRHSIFNDGRNSFISYKQRRYFCPICKSSFIEENPFVKEKDKVSRLLIYNVMLKLSYSTTTYEMIASELSISPTTVMNIFDQNINYPRGTLPEILSIDEFHYATINSLAKYACVFLNFETNKVIDVIKSRRKDYLQNYLTKIPLEERLRVKHVSIDMWVTYRNISKIFFPNAIISVDSFHVIQDINRYLDKIRISIMKKFEKGTNEYYLLKNFEWLLLINYKDIDTSKGPKYNKKFKKYLSYLDLLEMLLKLSPLLKNAYEWKESYIRFNSTCTYEKAEERLNELITNLKELFIYTFNPVLKTLEEWKYEIINSFIRYPNIGRVSNGKIENRNSTIKDIKKNTKGMSNFERFRNRIIYVINKDFNKNFTIKKRGETF